MMQQAKSNISYNKMNNPQKITRIQFLESRYLKVSPIDIEVNLLHHNRFLIEIILDQVALVSKKKYNEIKKFSEELDTRFAIKEFFMPNHMRSSEQYKQIEILFKKINSGYLINTETDSEKQTQKKTQVRNSLYNLLFNSIEQSPSSEEDSEIKDEARKTKRAISQTASKNKEDSQPTNHESEKTERDKSEGLDLKGVLKGIYKSKRQNDEVRRSQLLKVVKTLWIKEGQKWNQKSYALTDNALVIFEKQDNSKQIIVLKKLDVTFVDVPFTQITINHRLLLNPLEIRLADVTQSQSDSQTLNLYLSLFSCIKQISYRQTENIYNIVGIKINNKKNKIIAEAQKKPAKELSIKITHQSQIISFTMPIDSTTYLQLPITHNYGKVDVEVIESRELFLIPTFRENSITLTLPCQNIYDQLFNQKPKRKTPQMRYHILQSKHCNYLIKLDYFERSNRHSYYAYKPKDKFEADEVPVEFTREQFRIQRNRFKRIIYSTQQYLKILSELQNFQYPLRSYIFYLALFFSILLFDANLLVHYFIAFLCMLLMYCHPTFHSYYREMVHILKIQNLVAVLQSALSKRSHAYQRVSIKKDVQKRVFLQRFTMSTKNHRNIYKKYKRLQQILLKGQLALTEFVTFSQKIKNTFLWYHHKKTKELLILLLVSLLVIYFFPIRLMIIYLLIKVYNKGVTSHNRVRNLNRLIVYQIFKTCIEDNNFTEIKTYLISNTKPLEKKTSQYFTFEKKIKQYVDQILQIDYDNQLILQARTLSEMIDNLSDCRKRFIIPLEICHKYHFSEQWATNESSATKILLVIYGFLVNIPSDRNILGIKTTQADKNQQQNESQDEQDQA